MMRSNILIADALTQMTGHAFGQPASVHENQCSFVLPN
jgi:hypothetical protein